MGGPRGGAGGEGGGRGGEGGFGGGEGGGGGKGLGEGGGGGEGLAAGGGDGGGWTISPHLVQASGFGCPPSVRQTRESTAWTALHVIASLTNMPHGMPSMHDAWHAASFSGLKGSPTAALGAAEEARR